MAKLTHLTASGEAKMVDITEKEATHRTAEAEARIIMQSETLDLVMSGSLSKGEVFSTARIAGIQASKRTSELIPLCHPLALTNVEISFTRLHSKCLQVRASCQVRAQTGVEMEALTAVSVASLTIYDMVKAVEKGVIIENIALISKHGGKSGDWQR
ncbi:MAG: cyclic pyranopterin monophosphate synthase MoaC [Gammaproteobacteria bacterium]|nr:cyclic pyranopterin monophosphate synthase MoaC [Gammaproteobacteria bacterium]